MKKILTALFMAAVVLVTSISIPASASPAYEIPILEIIHCEPYIQVGEKQYYQVGVANAEKFHSISYQWYTTVDCLIGQQDGFKFGDTSDGFYLAETCTWLSGGQTDTLTLTQEASDKGVNETDGCRFVYKCKVTVDGKDYFTPVMYSIVIPERLVESFRIKGLKAPEIGAVPDTSVYLYGDNVELDSIEWYQKNGTSGWRLIEKADETFEEGVYAVKLEINALDSYHFNFDGGTVATLNDEEAEVEKCASEDNVCAITKMFFVTDKPEEGYSLNQDYTKYKAGNFYQMVSEAYSEATGGEIPVGAVVTILDASDSKKALVRYEDKDTYIAMQYLQFYGYGDGTVSDVVGKNYMVKSVSGGVNIAWKKPTGRIIANLPYMTVVTALGQQGPYLKFRYAGYICYAPINCFTETDEAAENLNYLYRDTGFFRVTANSVNVREWVFPDSERVMGLKKGDIVYGTEHTGGDVVGFMYQGSYVYVNSSCMERVSIEDIEGLDPVITKDLEDVTVKEGSTAVFSYEVDSPIYNDYFVRDEETGEYIYSDTEYAWAWLPYITAEEIEEKGWGKVTQSSISNELVIENCSRELDGFQLLSVAVNYGSVSTRLATLHVTDGEEDEKTVPEDLEVGWSNPTISIAKRDLSLHASNGEVLDEGMNEDGELVLEIHPHYGEKFTEELSEKVKVQESALKVKSSTLQESGVIQVVLEAEEPDTANNSAPAYLSVTSAAAEVTEGNSLSQTLNVKNGTGKNIVWSITQGELPSGVTFNNGTFSGSPAEGTEGVYPVTVKARTERVTEKVEKQTVTYKTETYTEAETGPISLTISKADVDANVNGRGDGYVERGYYGYTYHLLVTATGTMASCEYYDSATGDGGSCTTVLNGDGSLSLSHTGKRDVQKTRQVPVNSSEWVEKEVSPACESTAQFVLTVAPKHVHQYEKKLKEDVEQDCEKGLIYEYTCECGDVQEVTEYPEHNWTPWEITGGDCENGVDLEKTCTVCGKTESEHLEASGHQDIDGDGICDHCYYDMNDEIIAEMAGVTVEEVANGTWLTVLSERDEAAEESFREAGLYEEEAEEESPPAEESTGEENAEVDKDSEEQKNGFPWWLLILVLILLALGVTGYFLRDKIKKFLDEKIKKRS